MKNYRNINNKIVEVEVLSSRRPVVNYCVNTSTFYNFEMESEPIFQTDIIINPEGDTVEISPDVDWVYIMRKDGEYACTSIAESLAEKLNVAPADINPILLQAYDTFLTRLVDALGYCYQGKGIVQFHIYDADFLEQKVAEKCGGLPIVSLDPMTNAAFHLWVSRGYYLTGTTDYAQVSSPGHDSLTSQAKMIALQLDGTPVAVVEDDVFTGGSVLKAIDTLIEAGVNIQKVIPGIQVGAPSKLSTYPFAVDPAIRYQSTDDIDIFDILDLGDPRDFLLGASGLVIQLPSGEMARAPYLLPFVSTSARASIPSDMDIGFAKTILEINLEFFHEVEGHIETPVLLRHMTQPFIEYMHTHHGFDWNTPMTEIAIWCLENLETIWKVNFELGKQQVFHECVEALNLPQRMVLLDVDGTLIPDDSEDGYIDPDDLENLKRAVADLHAKGVFVGLCSDSPLEPLISLSAKLGLNGPIVAENGNLIFYNGQTVIVNPLEGIGQLKNLIESRLSASGFKKVNDCLAPALGGTTQPDLHKSEWSFGHGRQTSISVFGPPEAINLLGQLFSDQTGISCDESPQYGFFAVHPGQNYQINKGQTLAVLHTFGHQVTMVGNSMSDWVDPSSGVKCCFVGGSRISNEVFSKADYISEQLVMKGTIDILMQISNIKES